jgi:hypothetical protein
MCGRRRIIAKPIFPARCNVPYQMNSPKEVEYDDSVDAFDLTKLPKDKNAPMIFQCNGAECWYSYKAARYMVQRGYTKILLVPYRPAGLEGGGVSGATRRTNERLSRR